MMTDLRDARAVGCNLCLPWGAGRCRMRGVFVGIV